MHTIATEAQRRGWTVGSASAALTIRAQDLGCTLGISEEGVHRRGPWEEQVHRNRNADPNGYWWRDRVVPRGPYDQDATGQLTVALTCDGHWFQGRQGRWSDRQSWTLEERLPHLFREIEARIVHARRMQEEERIRAAEAAECARREGEQLERAWTAHMANARERLAEDHRIANLNAARRASGLARAAGKDAASAAAVSPRRMEGRRTSAAPFRMDVPRQSVATPRNMESLWRILSLCGCAG